MSDRPDYEKDRQLFGRCVAGDREAAEMLVRRFSDLVYHSIRQILAARQAKYSQDDIADLHNTVFLELFENRRKKLAQFKGKNGCSPATWIRTITVRIALSHLRKKGVDSLGERNRLRAFEDIPELRDHRIQPHEMLEMEERQRLFRQGLEKLPSKDRMFIRLHIEQGLSVPDAGEIMNMSAQNAYTFKHRVVRKLKSYVVAD